MNEIAVGVALGMGAGSILTYWMFQKGTLVVEGQDPVKGLNWIKAAALLNFILITVGGLALVMLGANWRELSRIPVDCEQCYEVTDWVCVGAGCNITSGILDNIQAGDPLDIKINRPQQKG